MFFDIGPLELVALVILAILVFGPEKLPKVIQDVAGFVRKVRAFSDNARDDIRAELGPEFKDFEFEDLNPKTFARKHLVDNDELGIEEIRNGFDLRKDLTELTDAVNGKESGHSGGRGGGTTSSGGSTDTRTTGTQDRVRLDKGDESPSTRPGDPPPFDADAT